MIPVTSQGQVYIIHSDALAAAWCRDSLEVITWLRWLCWKAYIQSVVWGQFGEKGMQEGVMMICDRDPTWNGGWTKLTSLLTEIGILEPSLRCQTWKPWWKHCCLAAILAARHVETFVEFPGNIPGFPNIPMLAVEIRIFSLKPPSACYIIYIYISYIYSVHILHIMHIHKYTDTLYTTVVIASCSHIFPVPSLGFAYDQGCTDIRQDASRQRGACRAGKIRLGHLGFYWPV